MKKSTHTLVHDEKDSEIEKLKAEIVTRKKAIAELLQRNSTKKKYEKAVPDAKETGTLYRA